MKQQQTNPQPQHLRSKQQRGPLGPLLISLVLEMPPSLPLLLFLLLLLLLLLLFLLLLLLLLLHGCRRRATVGGSVRPLSFSL